MSRTRQERVSDVRRLLRAAQQVYAQRSSLVSDLTRATGLSPEGVELGFASLERDATDDEIASLVGAAGDVRHVHVVLSANVFVAPMRALALARAAAPRVTVRPSPRDPVIARALVEAAGDDGISLVEERDVGAIEADAIHVYGRDATIAEVSARARSGTIVRGHGAGLGVAMISPTADLGASAEALSLDVVAFDQRGCLSPRVAVVVGDAERAASFAAALDAALTDLGRRIPRGTLLDAERQEAVHWCDTLAFAGRLWRGPQHAVGLDPGAGLVIPPTGRHVLVVSSDDRAGVAARIAPIRSSVVTAGSDDPSLAQAVAPAHARTARLGAMQRPPLDGPVDLR